MKFPLTTFKGRPAYIDPKTLTGTVRTDPDTGRMAIRLDDDANPEFWLEFDLPLLARDPDFLETA